MRLMTPAAARRRRVHHHLDHRHLYGPARASGIDHGRALQGLLDHGDPVGPGDLRRHHLCARRHERGDRRRRLPRRRHRRARRRRVAAAPAAARQLHRHGPVLVHDDRARASPALLVWITEYYTGTNYRPVRSIAKASETGHGTNVIQGLAISLEVDRAADAGDRRRGDRDLPARRHHRHRLRRDLDAGAGRHGRRARRLWPGHRQCRRHRRDGGAARRGARSAPTRSTRSATPPRR